MIQLLVVTIISMILSISCFIFYYLFRNQESKFVFWLYLLIFFLSLSTLTYTVIAFDISKDYIAHIFIPLMNWIIISFVTYEILKKFYNKAINERLYRLIILAIIAVYLLIIYLLKGIF